MRSFWFATSILLISIHFVWFATAVDRINSISKYLKDLKEELLSGKAQPLTLNATPLKALMYGAVTCPCGSCVNVDLSKYLTFYYSTDGISYKKDPKKVHFDSNLKTLIIIHGFCDSVSLKSPFWMVSLAEVMLLTSGYKNVILVDYSPLCCNYFTMSGTVAPQMGEYLANAIVSMKLNPKLIDILGYSLGAHISGFAGATLISRNQGKLNKIFALCKAAVNFDGTRKGLNASCASTVVDVISDNGNGIGSTELRGSAMYLMNANSILQPGCFLPTCNHEMCIHQFYAANHPDFVQDANQLRGAKCKQSETQCTSNVETSKLSGLSGKDTGCFCVNTPKFFDFYSTKKNN